ncbi:hypothetical protein BT96DRAFT_534354 [Gymnopus androsaceus JB14]|uniref:Uncharacterized protein n=1 Tax=Gymnopus androsaceus JB14 TaxID=1447944 RepID=A0A6A4IJD6_9AGAR|nr:hypothetical protein BT96DRAFT_534354 [Gymnopus androsaceus JB14]
MQNFQDVYDDDDGEDSDVEGSCLSFSSSRKLMIDARIDIFLEHDCTPNCTICRLRATIDLIIRQPDLNAGDSCTDDDEEVGLGQREVEEYEEDTTCSTAAPHTHCLPDCPACVREQLLAEGWKFSAYRYDDGETDRDAEAGDEKEIERRDPEPTNEAPQSKEITVQGKPLWCSNVFSPPPSLQSQCKPTLVSTGSDEARRKVPRVFFPPPPQVSAEEAKVIPAPPSSMTTETERGMDFRVIAAAGAW